MASRMLHYVVSMKVASRIKIADINRFIIGSLIPDASSHTDGSYDKAHFGDRLKDFPKKGINWNLFLKKYGNEILTDSLYKGYLCHLIADAVWFKTMTDKYIRIYPKKDRNFYIKKGYDDFKKMNGVLIEEFGIPCPTLQLPIINLKEVNNDLVKQVIDQFCDDFNVNNLYNIEQLEIYPYVDVKRFIEESVNICLSELAAIKNKTGYTDPRVYYTEPRS